MSDAARRRAVYSDLFDLPDSVVGEIVDGELIVSPRPRPLHAQAAYFIGIDVNPYARDMDDPQGPGGWWILPEPELHLEEHVLVPDIAGWRFERMPALPDEAFFTVAPDWACEVSSPSTARLDRLVKKPIYAGCGVEFMWIVEPPMRTLEVLRLEGGFYRDVEVYQGDVRARAAPFEGVELNLARWWRTRMGG